MTLSIRNCVTGVDTWEREHSRNQCLFTECRMENCVIQCPHEEMAQQPCACRNGTKIYNSKFKWSSFIRLLEELKFFCFEILWNESNWWKLLQIDQDMNAESNCRTWHPWKPVSYRSTAVWNLISVNRWVKKVVRKYIYIYTEHFLITNIVSRS